MVGYIIGMIFGSIMIIAALVVIIIFQIRNNKFKANIKRIGDSAENKINQDLKVWSKHTKNIFLPAAIYKYNENKVFEVDSILITNKALIVIEIKSIKGGIEGDCELTHWDKVLGEKRHKISNPVVQNERHIDHITKMCQLKVPMLSLIIFSNRASYLKIEHNPSHVVVIKHADVFDALDKIDKALPIKINELDSKRISNSIKAFKTNKRSDIKLHKNITNQKGK